MNDQIEKFKTTVLKTKNARFNAARRMRFNHLVSNITPPIMSAYVIAINLLVFSSQFEKYQKEITIFTIALSVLTLVVSLIIQNMKYDEMGKNYHLCGEKMNELYDKADLLQKTSTTNIDSLEKLYNEYHQILKDQNLNHREIDYLRAEHSKNVCYGLWWFFSSSWVLYIVAILMPVVLFLWFII